MLLALSLVVAALGTGGLCEECTLSEYQACLSSLMSVAHNDRNSPLVVTRHDLDLFCGKLEETVVRCVNEHMRTCFPATHAQMFRDVVGGARNFLLQLCVDGPLKEAYLHHSACFQNASEKCTEKYLYLMRLSEGVDQQRDVDDGLRDYCCAFNDFMVCKYRFVRQDCGQDAADFQQRHLERISSPLVDEHCAHFTYSDSCTATSTSPQPPFPLLPLLLVLSTMASHLKPR